MELENIVANTIYIKARSGKGRINKGRSKKWKQLLKLPNLNECYHISNEIFLKYEYIVNQQPIGHMLYHQFCMENERFKILYKFIESYIQFEILQENELKEKTTKIFNDFFKSDNIKWIYKIINQKYLDCIEEKIEKNIIDKRIFDEIFVIIGNYLRKEPFEEFIKSIYFKRYLQFKSLENLSITKKTFRMYRILGKGGFGEVCACQSRATGKMYACKKLEKKRLKKKKAEMVALNEKKILLKINSRFIINLAYSFETKKSLCFVVTLMNGGDLKFHIYSMGILGFEESKAIFYTAEIICGLRYLHENQIVYRDLKPENILLDDFGHIRISDLGLAVEILNEYTKGRVGTVGYMAPEVIKGDFYKFSPDWWGLGCIVYEMIEGKCPFRSTKERIRREEIDYRVLEEDEVYSNKFSTQLKGFCKMLLKKKKEERLGSGPKDSEEVMNHQIFQNINWKRIEAAAEIPPFIPDPKAVYAKNVLDIEPFSSVKRIEFDKEDHDFYDSFNKISINSIIFQQELIDTGCFDALNEIELLDFSNKESFNMNNLTKKKTENFNSNKYEKSNEKSCFKFRNCFSTSTVL